MKSSAQTKIRSISYARYGYYFILPFFIIYFIFQLVPLINTFRLSFYGNGNNAADYVGLQNFQVLLFGGDNRSFKALHDTLFKDLGNTLILWFGNFIPQLGLSLLLAVWFTDINLKIKGKTFFKIVMYLPNIVTAASVAALFLMLFSKTEYGPINSFLLKHDIISSPIDFVRGKWQSRGIIMFAQTWMWFGNTMIMLMSAIMGISKSLFEAADIDGANSRQVFTKITLPLLRPMVIYTLITSMIGGLQMWDLPYLYKNGTAWNKETETIAVFIYNKFHIVPQNFGYSAAASLILFVITTALGSVCFAMNIDKDDQKKKALAKEQKKLAKLQNKSAFGGF
ncbi:sugar ABC transporter permease [Ruminococcus sp. HUN007]|uniref:carbohydrate ABC transporter permease n=1 Tax=Ruminococcus sp. HUN007 TaxID=1514668 RepID=UPI0005D1EB1D|nr:sugar ABC transporter permease [Ruminococcus sp. HUN007]